MLWWTGGQEDRTDLLITIYYFQAPPLDNYHETSLSGRNGGHSSAHPGSPDPHHEGHTGVGGHNHKDHEQELFIDPVSCPRYMRRPLIYQESWWSIPLRHSAGLPELRGPRGEMNNFRQMLGLDTRSSAVQHKPRTMKDSKEIMKKRRERAICIVSIRPEAGGSTKTTLTDIDGRDENYSEMNVITLL